MVDSVEEGVRDTCMLLGRRLATTDHRSRLQALVRRANEVNVSFIPVNPAGLVTADSPASETITPARTNKTPIMADDLDRLASREDGLLSLASGTDSMAVVKQNDLHAGLRKITDQLRSFYLLGYYSTNRTFDGLPRRISVSTTATDIEVRARRGYRAPTDAERAARANPVTAAGPSPVELALDVLAGIRSADDRSFDASRYLKADAAPILGVPIVSRATPSPRSPIVPITAPVFSRRERIHVEWPLAEQVTERGARLLGRNGKPLAVQVTLTERDQPSGALLVADAVLSPLAPGDYVIEVRVVSASGERTTLIPLRVVP